MAFPLVNQIPRWGLDVRMLRILSIHNLRHITYCYLLRQCVTFSGLCWGEAAWQFNQPIHFNLYDDRSRNQLLFAAGICIASFIPVCQAFGSNRRASLQHIFLRQRRI